MFFVWPYLLKLILKQLYIYLFVCSVQCLCEDRDPFAILLEKTHGMGICDPLVLQVANVSTLIFKHYNNASASLLAVHFFPRPLTFNRSVGEMFRLASIISFVVPFSSGRKGLMTMKSYLFGSLALRGFKN